MAHNHCRLVTSSGYYPAPAITGTAQRDRRYGLSGIIWSVSSAPRFRIITFRGAGYPIRLQRMASLSSMSLRSLDTR